MTYREALSKLPIEYREAALRNTQNGGRIPSLEVELSYNGIGYDTTYQNIVTKALGLGFGWRSSPEGNEYWQDIFKKINFTNYILN